MKRKPTAALLLAPIAAIFCASPVNADELDAGFSDPTPPPFSAPAVPADLHLVTDVYAGDVVDSSGNTTTYSTATVRDMPSTYNDPGDGFRCARLK